ncbi:Alpha/Beta hydrolase protein [Chytridium lagenaria]|nr:Alpha/Beta hydrolase protein [Chytridium lagenaria]
MPSIQDIHRYAPHTISNFKTKQPGEPQLYYELHGTGKNKMLLVTGLSSNCVSWEATINFFLPGYRTTEEVEDEYEICIFDNRCVGDSETLSNGFKVKDMALDAMDLLRHLGWTKNVFLAGVSMGGMISLELALLAPKDTFAKVCFISTHAGRTIPPLKSAFSLLNILFKKGKIPDSERVRLLVQLIFSPTWLALRPNEEEVRIFQRQIVGDVSTHPDIEIKSLEDYKTNLDAVADMLTRHGNTKPTQTEAGRKAQIMAINSHYVSKERLRELGKAMEGIF